MPFFQSILQGAVTHDDREEKTSVTVEWIPNGFTGDVIFKYFKAK